MKRVLLELDNGEKIIIRHLKKTDVDGVWSTFNEVLEEGKYLPVFSPVKSEFEKKSWYENVKKDKEVCLIAENPKLKAPNNIVGQCEITNTEWEAATHVGILGIIIRKEYRDKKIGEILIDLSLRESKKLNNKDKMILACFKNNERALHLYRKMGFKEVGVREKQFYMDGTYYDEVLMELWIDDYIANNPKV